LPSQDHSILRAGLPGEASERCDPGAGDQGDGHYQDNAKHAAAKRWIAAAITG